MSARLNLLPDVALPRARNSWRTAVRMLAVVAVTGLGACAAPGPGEAPDGVHDPYEENNREVHAFNRGLDKNILAPVSRSYVAVVPEVPRKAIDNVVDTLGLPRSAVNQLLQARFGDAIKTTTRFAINLTFGLLGTRDAASDIGLYEIDSDFGETLYTWGFNEGVYVELPVLGPSTERAALGKVVDTFLDPLGSIASGPERQARRGASVLSIMNQRGTYDETVTDLLHESADSYAQLQLFYLQNRRFELGYAPPQSQGGSDPFALDTEGF